MAPKRVRRLRQQNRQLRQENRALTKKAPLYRQAKRSVNIANRPYERELDRQAREAKDRYGEQETAYNDIYNRLGNQLGQLRPEYNQAARGITQNYTKNLEGLVGMLAPALPETTMQVGDQTMSDTANLMSPEEQSAGVGLFGGLGAGGYQLLASDKQRNLDWMKSSQAQSEMDRAQMRKNNLEDMRDILDEIDQGRLDLKREIGPQILARWDELRAERQARKMQERELAIAEEQFNKTFGLQKQEQRSERRNQRRQTNFVRDEAERAQDQARIRPLRKDIRAAREDIKALNRLIESLGQSGGPEAIVNAARAEELREKKARKEKKIAKKRKKIQRIRRS